MKKFIAIAVVMVFAIGSMALTGAVEADEIGTALSYWTDGELLDGDYRGAYVDGPLNAIVIQFTVEDGVVVDTNFRGISYADVMYDTEEPVIPEGNVWWDYAGEEGIKGLTEQYISALSYLEGAESFEEIKAITKEMEGNPGENTDLYEYIEPKEVEGNVIDTFSAATIRSDKIGSAIRDAINRGRYR